MEQTLQLFKDLGISGMAVLALLLAVYGWGKSRQLDQVVKIKEADLKNRDADARVVQLQTDHDLRAREIESDKQVALVRAEAENNNAVVTARFLDIAEWQKKIIDASTIALVEHNQLMRDMSAANAERTLALNAQSASLDHLSAAVQEQSAGFQQAFADAEAQTSAGRAATDNQLAGLKAGIQHSNEAIDATKSLVEQLPAEAVVLELSNKAQADHARIMDAVQKITQQIDGLPDYLTQSLMPILSELRAQSLLPVMEELRNATTDLRNTESALIAVVRANTPPATAESTPLNERAAGAV